MSENCTLMYKNLPLGILEYYRECDNYKWSVEKDLKDFNKLPDILYPRFVDREIYKPSKEFIKEFIKSRVIPENRENLKEVLEKLGLGIYNEWDLLLNSRGMTTEDYYWVALDGDRYESIHIKYLFETGNLSRWTARRIPDLLEAKDTNIIIDISTDIKNKKKGEIYG